MQHKQSNTRPNAVTKFEGSGELWLAKNIVEGTVTDSEGNVSVVYDYDETMCHTSETAETAEAHFDTFWEFSENGGGDSVADFLRKKRSEECFSVCDRPLWLEGLTTSQMMELRAWRNSWLIVTETLEIPKSPSWL